MWTIGKKMNILEFAFKVCYENGSGYPFRSVGVRYNLEWSCLFDQYWLMYVFTGLRKIACCTSINCTYQSCMWSATFFLAPTSQWLQAHSPDKSTHHHALIHHQSAPIATHCSNTINCYNFAQLASNGGTRDSNSNCRHPCTSSNCSYPSTSSNCHSRYLHQQTQKSPPSSSLASSKLRILGTAPMVK